MGNIEHIVKGGETLSGISNSYSVDLNYLLRINNIKDKNKIYVGQRIKLVELKDELIDQITQDNSLDIGKENNNWSNISLLPNEEFPLKTTKELEFFTGKATLRGINEDGIFFVYKGDFKNGEYDGKGSIEWSDGSRYKGDFKNGEYDGKGSIEWSDGSRYKGDFKNGEYDGKGYFYYSDGSVYDGTFRDGKEFNGIELDKFHNGDLLGEWVNGSYRPYEGGYYKEYFSSGQISNKLGGKTVFNKDAVLLKDGKTRFSVISVHGSDGKLINQYIGDFIHEKQYGFPSKENDYGMEGWTLTRGTKHIINERGNVISEFGDFRDNSGDMKDTIIKRERHFPDRIEFIEQKVRVEDYLVSHSGNNSSSFKAKRKILLPEEIVKVIYK